MCTLRLTHWGEISADLAIEADPISSLQARGACAARAADPFDADPVTDFDRSCLRAWTELDHRPNAFVAADLAGLGGMRKGSPGIGHDSKVGMTHATMRSVRCTRKSVSNDSSIR